NTTLGLGGALAMESVPTDYTVDTVGNDSEGDRQMYRGHITGIEAAAKLTPSLYKSATQKSEFAGSAGLIQELTSISAGNPFVTNTGTTANDILQRTASRFGTGYSWLTGAMAKSSSGQAMAGGAGAGSAALTAWNGFSGTFNSYSTPLGWVNMLGTASSSEVQGIGNNETEDLAYDYLQAQDTTVFNESDFSYVVQCTFENNVSGQEGGAVYLLYDNVHI